jgi:hypothetical protein
MIVYIIDNLGFNLGFNTIEASIEQGLSFVETAPNTDLIKPKWENDTWIEGATPEEIAEAQRLLVPQEVQLWKIRTVISLMGLKETIEDVMNNLEEPTKSAALNIWNYGTAIDRNSQTVLMIQSILQMTEVEVDNIFIQANNIIL